MSKKVDQFSPIYNTQMALYRTRAKLKTGQVDAAKIELEEAILSIEQAMRTNLFIKTPTC